MLFMIDPVACIKRCDLLNLGTAERAHAPHLILLVSNLSIQKPDHKASLVCLYGRA